MTKIHIDDLATAFHEFFCKAASIRVNHMREPAKWEKEMETARVELRSKIEPIADQINWSRRDD